MNILFINGSPNRDGNTASLAGRLLKEKMYDTLNLTDYRIGSYGQELPDDQLDEIITKIKAAEVVVIGSPLYWHNICGSVRNMLDRFYGLVEEGSLSGRTLYSREATSQVTACRHLATAARVRYTAACGGVFDFLFQGAAPEKWTLDAGEYTMKRFAGLYGMKYAGMATNKTEADKLSEQL